MTGSQIDAPSARPGSMVIRWLGLALIVAWAIGAFRIVSVPEESLVADVIIDDALYFALPARHWWQGLGFSFDGLEPTNGVQTLWALVTTVIAGVVADPTLMLRCMVAVSGLCWGAAALLLFGWLRPRSQAAALLASGGFAWCGLHNRLAFQGMENGLHALLGAVILVLGSRLERRGWTVGGTLGLGVALALFALSRTEGVLLAIVAGAALVFGWLQPALARTERLRRALLLAVPGVLLVGGALVLSQLWFDSWLPISGRVKTFYESLWGGSAMHGGALRSIGLHLNEVGNLSLTPLRYDLAPELATLTGTGPGRWRTWVWILLAATAVLATVRGVRGRHGAARPFRGANRFAGVFALYAVVHVALMAVALPHFTSYGTWYFATETTALWLGIGAAVATCTGFGRWVAIVVAVAMAITGTLRNQVAHILGTRHLQRSGQWLAANTPPGTVIGTLSSGYVAWYAAHQHVVNLDGLINNGRYLENYLRPGRVPEYFDDRGITWFTDYLPRTDWKKGIPWHGLLPAERLVPRSYRRTDALHANAIWQILPRGRTRTLLAAEAGDEVRDHHVELAVAADVHGRYPVIEAAALPEHRSEHPDHVVARSLVAAPGIELLHVMVPAAELDGLGLRDGTVHPERPQALEVAPGLILLGHDLARGRHGDRDFAAVTLYWSCRAVPAAERFELLGDDGSGTPAVVAGVGDCHGTRPLPTWTAGAVVTETAVLHPFAPDRAVRLRLRRGSDGREFDLTR
jgi:hypothetical protein